MTSNPPVPPVPPITNQFPIVDEMGKPKDYFIRWLQERGFQIDGILTPEQVTEIIQQWAALRAINTGAGLDGGGTLDNDLTLVLNAVLNDLNDVDTASTPPTDGQTLTYNASLGLWIPGAGGGGGGAAWQIISTWDFAIDGALAQRIVDISAYTDIVVVGANVTLSASNWRGGAFSFDGGVSYSVNTGDYTGVSSAGGIAISDPGIFFHATASSAARRWYYRVNGTNLAAPKSVVSNRADSCGIVGNVALAPATHIRISPVNSSGVPTGTFTGGKFWVLGRPKSGGGGGGGGGGTWEVASDVTISSPVASVVVDVQAYSEIEILIQNVTASASGSRSIQVSTDGGVTWWTTSGNYTWYNFSGVLTNNVCFSVHGISTSDARGGVARITNLRDASAPKVWQTPNNSDHGAGLFVGSNDPITHVRILNVPTGNLTGGRVVVSGLVA